MLFLRAVSGLVISETYYLIKGFTLFQLHRDAALYEPAGIIVSIKGPNPLFVRLPGFHAPGIDHLADVTVEIIDIPLLHVPIGACDLGKAIHGVILVGISGTVIRFLIILLRQADTD